MSDRKKIISVVLAVMMIFTFVPATAYAAKDMGSWTELDTFDGSVSNPFDMEAGETYYKDTSTLSHFYGRITMEKDGIMHINFSSKYYYDTIKIRDLNGHLLYEFNTEKEFASTIQLDAGTYELYMKHDYSRNDFFFTYTNIYRDYVEKEPNDTFSEAFELVYDKECMVLAGHVAWNDDYFSFDAKKNTIVKVIFENYEEISPYIYLYENDRTTVDIVKPSYDNELEKYVYEFEPSYSGKYFLKITTSKTNKLYGLTLKSESVIVNEVTRIYGDTRYETCDNITYKIMDNKGIDKLDTVIIASGKNFADALGGSYLAGVTDAPIIITNGNMNIEWFKQNFENDGKIYILGGTSAVPKAVEQTLRGYDVERLAGADRYETNLKILEEAISEGGSTDEILVCTGKNFADSLSASATGKPILLVGKELSAAQKNFLDSNSGEVYILGGVNAVSTKIEKEAGAKVRIAGASRFETSVEIAKTFFSNPESAVLAYSHNYPDGLCGGPLAMNLNAPLILTKTGKESAAVSYMNQYNIHSGVVLGGSGLISDSVTKRIFGVSKINIYKLV